MATDSLILYSKLLDSFSYESANIPPDCSISLNDLDIIIKWSSVFQLRFPPEYVFSDIFFSARWALVWSCGSLVKWPFKYK